MESRLCYCHKCRCVTRSERLRISSLVALVTLGTALLFRGSWRCQDCFSADVVLGNRPELDAIADGSDPANRYQSTQYSRPRAFINRIMGLRDQ